MEQASSFLSIHGSCSYHWERADKLQLAQTNASSRCDNIPFKHNGFIHIMHIPFCGTSEVDGTIISGLFRRKGKFKP